jgi:2-amino-4-hydroxy-6-hydroxymethyldihydropteridine diphosphokinase
VSASRQRAYVGLGSNLQDPARQVRDAFEALGRLPDTRLVRHSSLYRTAPVGNVDQPDFVNAAAELDTSLGAQALLAALLAIEAQRGRVRSERNAPRILDLDLLLYGGQCIDAPGLAVPHPRLHERAFVLVPLAEIASEVEVPGRGAVRELLARVPRSGVARLDA